MRALPWSPAWRTRRRWSCAGRSREEAIARFGDGGFADADAALAAYDDAAAAVADGFARKAASVSGAAAEVLTASAGLAARQGPARSGQEGAHRRPADHRVGPRRGRPVRRRLHGDGRADGRARHRPARHRAPGDRAPGRRARARRPHAGRALDPGRRGPRALRHRRPRPERHRRAWSPSAAARPATPRSSPGSSASRASWASTARWRSPPAPRCWSTARSGVVELRPGPRRGRPPGRGGPRRARAARVLDRPRAETADGTPVKLLANVADGESARVAAEAPVEGVGLFRTELLLPGPAGRAVGRRSRPTSTPRCWTPSAVATGTSWSARSTPARTSRSRSRRTRARRTRPWGCAGSGSPGTTQACSTTSSTGSRSLRERTGTTTWVMAPMVATVAEAARVRGQRFGRAGSRSG